MDAGRPAREPRAPRTWTSRRALLLHLTLVLAVPAFLGLFWWQVQRVRQGNTLSWAYVFEWPFFTCYAVYLWWKLVHDQPGLHETAATQANPSHVAVADRSPGAVGGARPAPGLGGASPEPGGTGPDERDGEEELAAYNRYLAALNASGRRKRW